MVNLAPVMIWLGVIYYQVSQSHGYNRKPKSVKKHPFMKSLQPSTYTENSGYYGSASSSSDLKCYININKLLWQHPFFVDPKLGTIVYPQHGENIALDEGQEVMLICSEEDEGNPNYLNNFQAKLPSRHSPPPKLVIVKCTKGRVMYLGRPVYDNEYSCFNLPRVIMRKTSLKCYKRLTMYKVGFWHTPSKSAWTNVYDVCANDSNPRLIHAKYTIHQIQKAIRYQQMYGRMSNDFRIPSAFPHMEDPSPLYQHAQQTLREQMTQTAYDNLTHSGKLTFNRGHLAPKGDFVYRTEQTASFFYGNSAPQWDKLNSGNYGTMESDVRHLTIQRGRPLTVYTGVSGILKYGEKPYLYQPPRAKIHLQRVPYLDNVLPVPNIFWKIVLDPATKQSVALVVHNKMVDPGEHWCEDITEDVEWLQLWRSSRQHKNKQKGVSYACKTDDFLITDRHLLPHDREYLAKYTDLLD